MSPVDTPTPAAAPHLARCLCGGRHLERAWEYFRPPPGERPVPPGPGGYHRRVLRCLACGHLLLDPGVPVEHLEGHLRVNARDTARLQARFAEVELLPAERSDTRARVARIGAFTTTWMNGPAWEGAPRRALDVGCGLGLVAAGLAGAGWAVTALDADPRMAEIARCMGEVATVCAPIGPRANVGRFELVTLTDVLTDVADPVALLTAASGFVAPGGVLYLDVFDADAAAAAGPERPEFHIQRLHCFTAASLGMLIGASGVSTLRIDRYADPSGRFRLGAFCTVPVQAGPDEDRRLLRQLATARPGGGAAAWAALEEPVSEA
ncbi:MAG: methyltransferase domain-containing protein [Thermoleophilia bacterium]